MNSQRNVRLISGISVLCFLIFLPRVPAQDGSAETFIADSTDLGSSRKSAEAAYRAAEEASQQVAREYRTESAQKSPDAKALAEWKQKLTSAVKAAFEAQMKLQQVRLQIAQRDLADVQSKHQRRESLASKIIERRVADLMNGEDLEWPQMTKSDKTTGTVRSIDGSQNQSPTTEMRVSDAGIQPPSKESARSPVPNFATPQELIDHVETFFSDDNEASVEHYVELLTDDEVKRFSGFLLRTHSTLKAVAGLMATFGSNDPDGDAFDFMSLTTALGLSIEKHRLSNPPPAAESAYQQISEGFNVLQLFTPSQPKPAIDADVYSNLLRTASGVLKDPKSFLRDAMTEMKALAKNSEKKDDAAAKPKKPAEWQVTVDGDTATAVNVAAESDESSPLGMAQTMELVKVGNTWKISSIIPDRVIIEMQQGMTATSSTSNSSDNSDGAKQPSVSRSYPEPVEHIVGTNAAVAKSDIRPYSELSDSNVTTSVVYPDEQKTSALGKGSVVGKYLNRHLKMGEEITAKMLIEKPTTEQIVDFWLGEAVQKKIVFRHVSLYFTREPGLNFSVIPYDNVSGAKDFSKGLPEWTDEYLKGVHERLNARPQEQWTSDDINVLWSISDVIFFQRKSDSRNLKPIGELLSSFVGLDNEALSKIADPSVRKDAHSALILGEAVRINGSLPNNVLELRPTDDAILGKLNLLQQMVENGAEDKWIGQEQIRLADLLNEAPVQALKLLLASAPIKNQHDIEHWVFAMSPNATYREWRSSPPGSYSPPIDPVVAVAIAELLVGNDEMTDNNLALLFEQQHPGLMFSRHLDDLLASELAYRDSVLKSLVSIYRKSKSESLKTNIAKLAPAVPVMAAKDVSPEAEPKAK